MQDASYAFDVEISAPVFLVKLALTELTEWVPFGKKVLRRHEADRDANCSSREPCSRSFQRATRRSRRRDNGPAAYFFVEFWSILALKLVPLPGKFWCGRNNWGMSVLGSIPVAATIHFAEPHLAR